MIYGMGMLELGVTFSFAQLVMDNDIAKMVKRVVQGIDVTDDTLAVDVIKKVGAGGDFLAQKHTRQFMGTEQSKPLLIDRRMRGAWQSRGGKDFAERCADKALEILKNHKPDPLPPEVLKQMRGIVEEVEKAAEQG